MRPIFSFLFLALSLTCIAQEEVPELITDRPDQTESSAVVPVGSLQIESGFVRERIDNETSTSTSYAVNTTLLRYGLTNHFELRVGLDYLHDRVTVKASDSTGITRGFGPLHTGFKIKIRDENGWIPEVAFLGGLTHPFAANPDYRTANTAAGMRFAFSHTITESISLGYNLGAEWDGDSVIPGYFYSLVMGASITERTGFFAESYGIIRESGTAEHLVDAGLTFLAMDNLQFDLSGGLGINEQAIDHFLSVGFSLRL